MPFLLRKVRKAKWYREPRYDWLPEGDLEADALGDLITKSNKLSTWYIEDNSSNLEQVIVALAGTSDHVPPVDYALVSLQVVLDLGIEIDPQIGNTPDQNANLWHRDLIHLTVGKVYALAQAIRVEHKFGRKLEKWLAQKIQDAAQSEHWDKSMMKTSLIEDLGL